MADIPTGVLKEAPLGKRGFDKDLVLAYVGELNDKINELEDELAAHEEAGGQHESQLIQEYRRDLEAAQKRMTEAERLQATAQHSFRGQMIRLHSLQQHSRLRKRSAVLMHRR